MISAVSVDLDDVTQQLIAEYDKDKNGSLSREELAAVPSIAERMARFDIDRNGQVNAEELQKNLNRIFDPNSAVVSPICVVHRNGRPLPDAEVRFVPIAPLKDVLPVATGVTDSLGATMVSAPREELPDSVPNIEGLMRPGLYSVEVTHKSINIPDKYNKRTILGKEVSVETVVGGNIVVNLKI